MVPRWSTYTLTHDKNLQDLPVAIRRIETPGRQSRDVSSQSVCSLIDVASLLAPWDYGIMGIRFQCLLADREAKPIGGHCYGVSVCLCVCDNRVLWRDA